MTVRNTSSALPAALVSLLVGLVVLVPATSASAASKPTRLSGWSGTALTVAQGDRARARVVVRTGSRGVARTVVLQRRADGQGDWSTVARQRTRSGGATTFRLPTAEAFDGDLRLRVVPTRRARSLTTAPRAYVVQAQEPVTTPAPGGSSGSSDPGEPNQPAPVDKPAPTAPTTSDVELEVVRLVNEARATARTCGGETYAAVGRLRSDDRLALASRRHAQDMGEKQYFSHTSADGRSPWDRARAAGYTTASGENIAAGYADARKVVDGWLKSDGHCRNIMSRDAKEIGVGYANVSGSPFGKYWVQMFGRG